MIKKFGRKSKTKAEKATSQLFLCFVYNSNAQSFSITREKPKFA